MAQTACTDLRSWDDPGDNENRSRLHFRCWQVEITAMTVLVTTWFCNLGPAAAIVALLVAKHMLVSILVVSQANVPSDSGIVKPQEESSDLGGYG